jgi:peptide/nickel transport system permease protein
VTRYVIKRIAQAVLVLFAAYTLAFVLLNALPGNAIIDKIRAPNSGITPAEGKILVAYYGLNKPLDVQYFKALGDLFHGNLGYSIINGNKVTTLLGQAIPSTLKLTGLAFLFGLVIGLAVAVLSNYARFRWVRMIVRLAPGVFSSVPTFIVGILFIEFFSFGLHLFPAVDNGSFSALVAPAVALGMFVSAPAAQVLGGAIAKTRSEPFVHVALAKGASEAFVFRRDIFRNSALPLLTLLGLMFGELIAGSIVTEAVFSRNGIGELTVQAVTNQDLPVVQGVVLVAAGGYIVINLLVDLVYPLIDPRILITGSRSRRRPVLVGGSSDPVLLGGGSES